METYHGFKVIYNGPDRVVGEAKGKTYSHKKTMKSLADVVSTGMGRQLLIKHTLNPENYKEESENDFMQMHHTPESIVIKMMNKVDNIKEKNILVMFNLEFLESLIYIKGVDAKNITFLADNSVKANIAKNVYKTETIVIEKENHKNPEGIGNLMSTMKFDLAFSNPPYNRSIDIKILKEVQPICDEMVIVHPSTWCIDLKGKTNLFNDFRTQINGKVKSVELFNGNPIFNIGLNVPTMITHIKGTHKGICDVKFFEEEFKVKSIFDVTKFGAEWFTIVKPFKETIEKWISTNSDVWSHNKKEIDDTKYHCQFSALIGTRSTTAESMVKNDFYTMVLKNKESNYGIRQHNLNRDGNPTPTFEFDNECEVDNFINFCSTDFARFCVAIYKNSFNLSVGEMSLIPWLDFTQEWDDEKLFEHFGIDETTQNYIRSFLPDYYGIRK